MGIAPAEGWYRDPFAIHEDRWMSQGRPTKLVRDGGTESYDPPPGLPLPDVLEPVTPDGDASGDGSQEAYSNRRAWQAGLDAISGGAVIDEPGGDW